MRHKAYTDFFRNIARTHVLIQDNPDSDQRNFFRLNISADPFPIFHIQEFLEAQKSRININNQILLLESFQGQHRDTTSGSPRKIIEGSFIVLEKVKSKNFDMAEEVLDSTEQTAEEIIAYMIENMGSTCGVALNDDFITEKIGPAGSGPFYGCKVVFSYLITTNTIQYDQSRFDIENFNFCENFMSTLTQAQLDCLAITGIDGGLSNSTYQPNSGILSGGSA